MPITPPFNFKKWIDDNRHLLKPPVGNLEVYPNQELIVMVVGGPNSRTDFHVDPGAEFFYQLEGDMTLRVVEDGKVKDLEIKEGEVFFLPEWVPHSPQRRENTVGLVVERKRRAGEEDGFEWYCEKCGTQLYSERLPMVNIVKDLPPIFERYEANIQNRTCKSCGSVMPTRAESKAAAQAKRA
jgi:3-hydroxyanthranilate 3,4-dioxygenase